MKLELSQQGECDGPGQPHHEDAGRVRPRPQRSSGGDGGTDYRADEVTQEANDFQQLHPMLERVQANLKAIAHPQTVGPALLIAPNKD